MVTTLRHNTASNGCNERSRSAILARSKGPGVPMPPRKAVDVCHQRMHGVAACGGAGSVSKRFGWTRAAPVPFPWSRSAIKSGTPSEELGMRFSIAVTHDILRKLGKRDPRNKPDVEIDRTGWRNLSDPRKQTMCRGPTRGLEQLNRRHTRRESILRA